MSGSVPSCHSGGGGLAAPAGTPVVALAGAPNVGKSTLFNRLTGARRDVGNWPGTTVEVGRGLMDDGVHRFDVIDLPGAYSLDPLSPDEALTRALLVDVEPQDRPELVVVIGDAGRLSRSLYLVRQLRETDQRMVVALTMGDIAQRQGVRVDVGRAGRLPRRPGRAHRPAPSPGAHRPARRAGPRPGRSCAAGPARVRRSRGSSTWPTSGSSGSTRRCPSAVHRTAERRMRWSDRFDRLALSSLWGPLLFLAAMWAVFQLTTDRGRTAAGGAGLVLQRSRHDGRGRAARSRRARRHLGAQPRRRRADRRRRHAAHVRAADGDHVRPAGAARGQRLPGAGRRGGRPAHARHRPAGPRLPPAHRRLRVQRAGHQRHAHPAQRPPPDPHGAAGALHLLQRPAHGLRARGVHLLPGQRRVPSSSRSTSSASSSSSSWDSRCAALCGAAWAARPW